MLSDNELLDAISRTNLRNQLHNFGIVVAAITTNNQEGALYTFWNGEQNGSYEGLGIVWLLKDRDLFSQPRRTLELPSANS